MFLYAVVLFSIISFVSSQETSGAVCSKNSAPNDYQCVIRNLKNELELQASLLRELRREMLRHTVKTKDCSDLLRIGYTSSGVYEIVHPEEMTVFCDMKTDGGGWTVIHNRQSSAVNFKRTWIDYKNGFGDISGNHWLGNKYLHTLTSQRDYKLRIDLSDWDDTRKHAVYSHFRVGSESDNYQLFFDEYLPDESTVGDSLSTHNEMYFTTKDKDNDNNSGNCASVHGGFWHNSCWQAGLTNHYGSSSDDHGDHIYDIMGWVSWHGGRYSLKTARMMIRPMN